MYSFVKRSGDFLLSVLLLIVLLPLTLVLSLTILVADGRPVFFTQNRIGRFGRPFSVIKFRTLEEKNDPLDPASHTIPGGNFLRRFGIDELPQIVNILRGEMSFVGPRPILPAEVKRYTPEQKRRLDVAPGITGWAQVNGRNLLGWEERIEKDLWYVDNAGLSLDLRILLRTPLAILRKDGVYGPGNLDPQDEAGTETQT